MSMLWFCRQLYWILLGRVDMDVRRFHLTNLASPDQFAKAPMAVAKNSVLFESLCYLSVDIVRHVQNMRTKDSQTRMIGCTPHVSTSYTAHHDTKTADDPYSELYFPRFHIREYSPDHRISGLLINPLYGFSCMSYMWLQVAMRKLYALTSSCNFNNYLSKCVYVCYQ
jgi:hypothetical protein